MASAGDRFGLRRRPRRGRTAGWRPSATQTHKVVSYPAIARADPGGGIFAQIFYFGGRHRACGRTLALLIRPGALNMNEIAIPRPERPVDLTRRLVCAGAMAALVFALSRGVPQFEASKECRGGAFSAGFSLGFDVRRCDLNVKRVGGDLEIRIPLPQSLIALGV